MEGDKTTTLLKASYNLVHLYRMDGCTPSVSKAASQGTFYLLKRNRNIVTNNHKLISHACNNALGLILMCQPLI